MNGTQLILAAVIALGAPTFAQAQQMPMPRGSRDAVTVIPQPGAASQPALPAGHPTMPAGGGGMPAGHPDVGGGSEAMPMDSTHAGMGGPSTGALRVNFSQGTKGGPKLGKDVVTVQLFSRGVALKTLQAAIDDKGVMELYDLPLAVAFQPIITVRHAGTEQQLVGPPMNRQQPMIELDMPVYETTPEKPAWTIGLRDIEVAAVDLGAEGAGLVFTELVGGFNPTDRAWTGEIVGSEKRTVTFKLSPGAANVQLGPGLAEADARVADGEIVRGKTMVPGSTQYIFSYTMAPKTGKVAASFFMPADTTLFAMYSPPDAKVESLSGLELTKAGGTNAAQNRQLLKARSVKAGETLSVVFSGFKAPVAATQAAPLPQTSDLHLPIPTTKPESKP